MLCGTLQGFPRYVLFSLKGWRGWGGAGLRFLPLALLEYLLISEMKDFFVLVLIILEHKLYVWLEAQLVFISLELFVQGILLH